MINDKKTSEFMTKKKITKQHGCGDVRMAAEVAYFINGNVGISPCGENSTLAGERCGQRRGCMNVEQDGTGYFRAYRENTGERYESLMETANGGLMKTRRPNRPSRAKLVAKLAFPIGMGNARLVEQLVAQVDEMVSFLKTNQF